MSHLDFDIVLDFEFMNSKNPVIYVPKGTSTNVENIRQITPYLKKQSQFYAFFTQKR